MLRLLASLLSLSLAAAGVVLFYLWHQHNDAVVDINYFSGVMTLPLSISMLLAFALGLFLGLLLVFPVMLNLRLRVALLRRRLSAAKGESATVPDPAVGGANSSS